MAHRSTLTERQLALLRWVDDGCPEDAVHESSYRISMRALHNRDLVRISGRSATWRARITDAGREYLMQARGADPPLVRQANMSVTQKLVDDVIAAGGALRVPRHYWRQPGTVDYVARARLAERYRKVPAGKRLVVRNAGEELEISLIDAPAVLPVELAEVPVAQRVDRYHDAAREFRDRSERHEVSRPQLSRATRLMHAIATEALRRGWEARAPLGVTSGSGHRYWTATKHGHVAITASGFAFWIRLREEGVATRGPWDASVEQLRGVNRDAWPYAGRELASGPYDARATGQLKLDLFAEGYALSRGRQSRWADRQRWRLEDRLPHLFREIEERVASALQAAEDRREAQRLAAEVAQREAEERERQWHRLMAEARERLITAERARHVRAQAAAWQEADAIRRYCDAIEAVHGSDPSGEWVGWARAYADRLDPLREAPRMPTPAAPTPEALQEHLPPGWSAHGPEHGRERMPRWLGAA